MDGMSGGEYQICSEIDGGKFLNFIRGESQLICNVSARDGSPSPITIIARRRLLFNTAVRSPSLLLSFSPTLFRSGPPFSFNNSQAAAH